MGNTAKQLRTVYIDQRPDKIGRSPYVERLCIPTALVFSNQANGESIYAVAYIVGVIKDAVYKGGVPYAITKIPVISIWSSW